MIPALLAVVAFLAALLQALSGFGFALIVMPLMVWLVGLRTAAPLVALAGLTVYSINLIRYHRSVDRRELLRLGVPLAAGIPVGIWVLVSVDESIVNLTLGLILIAYAFYSLLRPATRRLTWQWAAIPAGFLAGCLGGAFNTPGPPVVVYGSLRQWPKFQFRGMLQTLYFVNALLVVASHAAARNLTSQVWRLYAYALPAIVLGILTGFALDRRVDEALFRRIVNLLVLALGLSLAFGLGRR